MYSYIWYVYWRNEIAEAGCDPVFDQLGDFIWKEYNWGVLLNLHQTITNQVCMLILYISSKSLDPKDNVSRCYNINNKKIIRPPPHGSMPMDELIQIIEISAVA